MYLDELDSQHSSDSANDFKIEELDKDESNYRDMKDDLNIVKSKTMHSNSIN